MGSETDAYYQAFVENYSLERRAVWVAAVSPALADVGLHNSDVLDLCCGQGAFSFYAYDSGARVVGVDRSPSMLQRASAEASASRRAVEFVCGDVEGLNLGRAFDVVLLMGGTVADFPPLELARLRRAVSRMLRPSGRFVVDYADGVQALVAGLLREHGHCEEGLIRREYLSEEGAFVDRYEREHIVCDRRYYVYTPAVLRALMAEDFVGLTSVRVGTNWIDVFRK